MKKRLPILVFILLSNFCYSQVDYSEDWINSGWKYNDDSESSIDVSEKIITNKDLSYLLKGSYPQYGQEKEIIPIYGLLGENFEKIEFVFTEITKSEVDAAQYTIVGKTKLHENIKDFNGTVTFNTATAHVPKSKMEQSIVVLTGAYTFTENSDEATAAVFFGSIKMILSVKNISAATPLIDMDMYYEDGAVRGFVGVRETKENNSSQPCIWGFSRFPYQYASRFDIGDGEEVINLKYAKSWFNYSEEEWNRINKGHNEAVYVHTNQEDKGIHTSEEAYIKPEEATWYKLDLKELEKAVVEQLHIDENRIRFISSREFDTSLNERIVVFGEIENEILEENIDQDYKLTSHILVVNEGTGKIKKQFSEGSDKNGWHSNAIYISDISLEKKELKLTENEAAFGVKTVFRSSSQPNPYNATYLSLYIKEDNSLKKVVDNLIINEYSGEVNVNSCYAKINIEKKEISVLKTRTNGYYDIQVKSTISNLIYETDATGECEPVEKSSVEKTTILSFNKTKYE